MAVKLGSAEVEKTIAVMDGASLPTKKMRTEATADPSLRFGMTRGFWKEFLGQILHSPSPTQERSGPVGSE
ncbi:MAG: hypothetical protein WA294_18445 [Acidobacteriaceae bacterium]